MSSSLYKPAENQSSALTVKHSNVFQCLCLKYEMKRHKAAFVKRTHSCGLNLTSVTPHDTAPLWLHHMLMCLCFSLKMKPDSYCPSVNVVFGLGSWMKLSSNVLSFCSCWVLGCEAALRVVVGFPFCSYVLLVLMMILWFTRWDAFGEKKCSHTCCLLTFVKQVCMAACTHTPLPLHYCSLLKISWVKCLQCSL